MIGAIRELERANEDHDRVSKFAPIKIKNKDKIMKTHIKKTVLILLALATLSMLLAACSETTPALEEKAAAIEAPAVTTEPVQNTADAPLPTEEAAPAADEAYPIEEETSSEAASIVEDDSASDETVPAETTISHDPRGSLSEVEAAGLLFMREEEKLARDVYLMLYEQWGFQVFTNIANSEQSHMDAIKVLLDDYELGDPAVGLEIGEFVDPDLQALYDQLIDQGSESLDAALRVGAAIEEIDILDLEEYIAQTDKEDIQLVYQNLLSGSENHLRAFSSAIARQGGTGGTYQPQYLDQDAYDAIINASSGRGGGKGGGNS